ncbi:MAG: PAS domain-containing protein [Rickettsiales bacterium]
MAQKSIEVILLKQVSDYLAWPVIILDPQCNLIFCNEPAEQILGFRFSDTGELPESEWISLFIPQDENGQLIESSLLPFKIALNKLIPVQKSFYLRTIQNKIKHISACSVPLINQTGFMHGVTTFFQEIEE